MRTLLLAFSLAACAGGPEYLGHTPRSLPLAAVPAPQVRLELRAVPWWTSFGNSSLFRLYFPPQLAPPGRALGAIRSADVTLAADEVDAVECAWGMGDDHRPCGGPRIDAMAAIHDLIARALDDLRTRAAAAGANVAADVRCYALRRHDHDAGQLWCEAVARAAEPGALAGAPDARDPAAPTPNDPPLAATRLAMVADGSFTMQGRMPVLGDSIGVRYRPLEATFDGLDLSRDGTERRLVALGLTGLARFGLGRATDALAGGSAAAVAPNGATNPRFASWWCAFGGLSYRSSWRWKGIAVPWIQLRAGAVRTDAKTQALVGLHVGFATPDR
jgi:hypothetical protein